MPENKDVTYIAKEDIERLSKGIVALEKLALDIFDDEPFSAAWCKYGAKILRFVQRQVEEKIPRVVAEPSKKPSVRHEYGADGKCTKDHGAGICGAVRVRKPRAPKAPVLPGVV